MAYKYPDLPKRSDPEYGKLYRKKMKELGKGKGYYKEYYQKKLEENPNYWSEKYDKEKAAEYRTQNKAQLSEKQWKHRGIVDLTYEKFQQQLQEQNHCCAICKKHMNKPQADHDHKTGKFRGILCVPCNNGLGIYEKNLERFQQYLGSERNM